MRRSLKDSEDLERSGDGCAAPGGPWGASQRGFYSRAWVELDLRSTATERTILTITQFVYNMVSMVTPQEYAIVSARISPETVRKLEQYLHYLNEREPGLNAKMSTVARMLIVRGLEQVEKEVGPLPPLPRKKG